MTVNLLFGTLTTGGAFLISEINFVKLTGPPVKGSPSSTSRTISPESCPGSPEKDKEERMEFIELGFPIILAPFHRKIS